MKSKRKIIINGCFLTFTIFILRSIGIFFSVYMARKIGSTAIGIFELLMSIYAFFVTFAQSGLSLACTRIVTENLATNDFSDINLTVRKCLFFSIFFGTFSSLLLCIMTAFLTKTVMHSQISKTIFFVISISLPFVSMRKYIVWIFSCCKKSL